MRCATIALISALFLVTACEDDPIVGPGGQDDGGGGSYGVIHFKIRSETPHDGAAVDSVQAAVHVRNENPKRF